MPGKPHHLDSVAATLRSGALHLLSPLNEKSPKGEKHGYLTAMLYLAPHTEAGGKSVCSHSTDACRVGCLYTAGRGKTPRVVNARVKRTKLYLNHREEFMRRLVEDLHVMQATADANDMTLAIRLNGTSDIGFERELIDGADIFEMFPRAIYYDYTRWPHAHRKVPENWRLTFSLADNPVRFAYNMLKAGRNIAAIVPLHEKAQAPGWFMLGETMVNVVDGEEHDLRFLDPPSSLVLLRPKGKLISHPSPMVRSALIFNLLQLAKEAT